MRKIIMFNMVSLDSYFAGPNGEIDWHMVDDEFNTFAIELLNNIDTILFGRVTYQLFESYWPNVAKEPKVLPDEIVIGNKINEYKKIVFSNTLEKVTWNNSELKKEIIPEEIIKMKQESGKDIVIYGSGTIVQAMTNLGLIDEYKLMVNRIILGKGKPLFKNVKDRVGLKLLSTKVFGSGNVLLSYHLTT